MHDIVGVPRSVAPSYDVFMGVVHPDDRVEATADGIIVVDPDGCVTTVNQRFIEMWRLPAGVAAVGAHEGDHLARPAPVGAVTELLLASNRRDALAASPREAFAVL